VANHSELEQLSSAIADAAASAAPSIVEVASHRSLSSGFIWREGLIVTADEALADEGKIAVEFSDGSQREVRLIGRDAATDIALLQIEGVPTNPIALTTALLRPGALTIVAAAAESAPLIASGSVAAIGPAWRSMRGGKIDARIDLDLRLRRRAEGGLALDASGRAYGMAVRGRRGRTLVIPAATIERVAPLLLEHSCVPRGYLGLGLSEVAVAGEGHGLMVVSVDENGPGAAAGILQGDVILGWNSEPVLPLSRRLRSLDHDAIGESVTLSLRRAGVPAEAVVSIGTRPRR
jgi:S1-C subfamily serine protease